MNWNLFAILAGATGVVLGGLSLGLHVANYQTQKQFANVIPEIDRAILDLDNRIDQYHPAESQQQVSDK